MEMSGGFVPPCTLSQSTAQREFLSSHRSARAFTRRAFTRSRSMWLSGRFYCGLRSAKPWPWDECLSPATGPALRHRWERRRMERVGQRLHAFPPCPAPMALERRSLTDRSVFHSHLHCAGPRPSPTTTVPFRRVTTLR